MEKYRLYVSGTAPYHKNLAVDVLMKSEIIDLVASEAEADFIYHIFGPDLDKRNLFSWLGPKKHIVHWIGSDTNFYTKSTNSFSNFITSIKKFILNSSKKRGNLCYLASAPWIGDIIQRRSQFPVEYVLISTISKDRILRIDTKKDVDFLTYIPFGREETYSLPAILNAARGNPENHFAIVVPNVSSVGTLEWDLLGCENVTIFPNQSHAEMITLICRSKCFLRLKYSEEDAYALTVLEALFCGCNVLWNVPNSGLLGVTFLPNAFHLSDFLANGGREKLLSMCDMDLIAEDVEKRFSEKEWVRGIERALKCL